MPGVKSVYVLKGNPWSMLYQGFMQKRWDGGGGGGGGGEGW